MIVRHHHGGKVYSIELPPGSRVRRSLAAGEGVVFVPHEGGEIPVFEVPGKLMVELARAGRHGLRLLGVEEVPESDIRE
jgi:hypothetical protein